MRKREPENHGLTHISWQSGLTIVMITEFGPEVLHIILLAFYLLYLDLLLGKDFPIKFSFIAQVID